MNDRARTAVRNRYASIARNQDAPESCCGEPQQSEAKPERIASSGCCGPSSTCCGSPAHEQSQNLGYDRVDLESIPAEADLGLGCGNPTAIAAIRQGETVVDLGSGGGIDCFLAARKVGESGRVIGVDMTPEMIDRARTASGDYPNVEFRLGEIEHLPIADDTADVIISNCVINLSPEKPKVFGEAFRVLKKGGRLQVSDVVLLEDLPKEVLQNEFLLTACVAGASRKQEYLQMIADAGFSDVKIEAQRVFSSSGDGIAEELIAQAGLTPEEAEAASASIASIEVTATK